MNEYNLGKGWHLDKRFSVGHVLTTIVVGVSALMYITSVEKRVALLESKMEQQDEQIGLMLGNINRSFDRLEAHLIRIETKLDKKQDK